MTVEMLICLLVLFEFCLPDYSLFNSDIDFVACKINLAWNFIVHSRVLYCTTATDHCNTNESRSFIANVNAGLSLAMHGKANFRFDLEFF